jgi:hypothetical protein
VHTLTALTKLATYRAAGATAKMLIMVDEYQRVGELPPKTLKEINAGLHTYFNANSTGLELMLSFSFGRFDNVKYLLSSELKSRAEVETIKLDVLKTDEASEFMQDLLSQFRVQSDVDWAYPFTPAAIRLMIQQVAKQKTITPRRLMKYGDHLLSKCVMLSDNRKAIEIGADLVQAWLSDPELYSLDDDET